MKPLAIAVSLLALLASYSGFACEENLPCRQARNDIEALRFLSSIEGNIGEARTGLDAIKSVQRQNGLPFNVAFNSYADLLTAVGSGNTAAAVSTFTAIGSMQQSLSRHARLMRLTQRFIELLSLEGNASEALSDLQVVHQLSLNGLGGRESFDSFLAVLRAVGAGNSSAAQDVVRRMGAMAVANRGLDLRNSTTAFLDLLSIEGNSAEALSDLELVNSLSVNGDFHASAVFASLSNILSRVGAGNTSAAQEAARQIAAASVRARGLFTIIELTDVFARLLAREGNSSEALGSTVLVAQGARACNSLSEASSNMDSLYEMLGAGNTAQIQSEYRAVYGL